MVATQTSVLLIEDNPVEAQLIQELIGEYNVQGLSLVCAQRLGVAIDQLNQSNFDVVLLDLNLPDSMGLDTLNRLQIASADVPVVILTGIADEDLAMRAIQEGAQEYLVKGNVVDSGQLLMRTIRYAIERGRIQSELRLKHHQLESTSAAFRNVVERNRDGILVVDQQGMVRFANQTVNSLFGWEHINDGFPFGFPLVSDECAELDIIKPDATQIVVEMSVAPTEWEGHPAFVASLRDITERKLIEERLRQAKEMAEVASQENLRARSHLQKIIDALQHPFYVVDAASYRVTMANAHVNAGFEAVTCHQLTHNVTVPCGDQDHPCPLSEVVRTRRPVVVEHLHYDVQGRAHYYEVHGMPMFDEAGHVMQMVEYSLDITRRKQLEEELKLAGIVLDSVSEAVMVTDASNRIVLANPAFSRITGYTSEEAIGRDPRFLQSGRHDSLFYATMWRDLLANGTWEGEIWNRRKSGEIFPEWLSIATIRDQHQTVVRFAAIFTDISKRKADEEELRFLANYDPLTLLPNRMLFRSRLEWSLARAQRDRKMLALFYIDLDRFKWVNDNLGHAVGDQLLVEASRRLESCIRKSDTVGRLGGDEFAVVLTDLTEIGNAATVAGHMRAEMVRPFLLAGHEVLISCSIGIALFPDDAVEIETLLDHADQAMYRSKQGGRNLVTFYGERSPS
ncbi:MAG: diguanylate cyclase [Magnetococcales bacterium]|nr:diguanylate cyclase [Magnetococcales bacterium]